MSKNKNQILKDLSRWLPYFVYDPDNNYYYNKDDSFGFLFLCVPASDENDNLIKICNDIIKRIPDKVIISFHFLSFNNLYNILEKYYKLHSNRQNFFIEESIRNFYLFLNKATEDKFPYNYNIKKFSLIISVKIEEPLKTFDPRRYKEYLSFINQKLLEANLTPIELNPHLLVPLLNQFFTGKKSNIEWNEKKEILSSQMVPSELKFSVKNDKLYIGNQKFMCLTLKNLYNHISLGESFLFKDVLKNNEQILSNFMYSVVIKRKENNLFYLCPFIWIWNQNEIKLEKSREKIANLFETYMALPQKEDTFLTLFFVQSLPLGFSLTNKEIEAINRYYLLEDKHIISFLPVIGDFRGDTEPCCVFVSRSGQIVSFDPIHSDFKNCVILKNSQSNLLTNYLLYSLYSADFPIKILTLQNNYEKFCKVFNGKMYDFAEGFMKSSIFSLNPFLYINDESDFIAISDIILSMLPRRLRKTIHKKLVEIAIKTMWKLFGNEATLEHIYTFFNTFPSIGNDEIKTFCEENKISLKEIQSDILEIAQSLFLWSSSGPYAEYFNSKEKFELSSDFIVFNLSSLKDNIIFEVVKNALINIMLNVTNKRIDEILFFDNAEIIFKKINKLYLQKIYTNKNNIHIFTATESISNFFEQLNKEYIHIILNNSGYWFLSSAGEYQQYIKFANLLGQSVTNLLLSFSNSHFQKYEEIILRSPYEAGIVRIVLSKFLYYFLTSDSKKWLKILNRQNEIKTKLLTLQANPETVENDAFVLALEF